MLTQDNYLEERALTMRYEAGVLRRSLERIPRFRVFSRRRIAMKIAQLAGAERELWRAIGKAAPPPPRRLGDDG